MHKPAVENKGLMSVKCLFSGMRDTEMVFHRRQFVCSDEGFLKIQRLPSPFLSPSFDINCHMYKFGSLENFI